MKSAMMVFVALSFALGTASDAHETDTKKALNEIAELAADSVGNGWTSVDELKERKFNLKQQIVKIDQDVEDFSDCKLEVVVGRKVNLSKIYSESPDRKVADKLYSLHKAGKIKAIIAKQWDEASGDSEYCSVYHFRIFSTDGHVLTLRFELTD